MSGLAAIFQRDGQPVEPARLWEMLRAVPHRGLDGAQVRRWDTIGLGHARLALTPEDETEPQPLVSVRTGCAIVADVRLDNRDELLAQLPVRLAPTTGDAELILHAYEAWGLEAPGRLLGDFAFVLWDPRQARLVAARDRRGQKPLYYRAGPQTVALASEIHQLFQDPTMPMAPNEDWLRLQLVPFYAYRNEKSLGETAYQGISAIAPAHWLTVTASAVSTRPYWRPSPPAEVRYRTDDEYAEHFRGLFTEAVRARLRSSRPIGALLSGGLDSSSVVCVAQELYRTGQAVDRGFTSFSATFPGLECDETHLIEELRAKYGFRAQYVPRDYRLTGWLDASPQGFRESPLFSVGKMDALGAAIVDAGSRVVLSGDVADAIVRGSPFIFDSLLRQGKLRELGRQLRVFRRLSGERLRDTLAQRCLLPLLPLALQRPIRLRQLERELRAAQPYLLPHWMPEPLRQELSERHLQLALQEERERQFASPARAADAALLWPPEVARPLVNWPVEIWRPWNDVRLHEFLLAIPPDQKYSRHPTVDDEYAAGKQILRRALRGSLPEAIRARTHQTHFGATVLDEFQQRWPDFEAVFGPGAESRIAARGLIDPGRFWARLQQLRETGRYGPDFIYIITLTAFETWLRAVEQPWPQRAMVPAQRTAPVAAGRRDPRREQPVEARARSGV